MRDGSWGSILLINFYGVLAGACLGIVIPLVGDITHDLAISRFQASLIISILALVSAVVAPLGGWLIDRVGTRQLLIFGAVVCLAGCVSNFFSTTYSSLLAGRAVVGIGYIALLNGVTAMIMRTVAGPRRESAMALVGATIPVGVGLGEALAGLAGGASWHRVFVFQAALLVLAILASPLLPAPPRLKRETSGLAGLLTVYAHIGQMRLSLAIGLIIFTNFGISTIFPTILRYSHRLSLAASADIGGLIVLSGIFGSTLAAVLLGRHVSFRSLAIGSLGAIVIAGAFVGQRVVSLDIAIGSCIAIAVAAGIALSLCLALLPRVTPDPALMGAASGVFNQVLSIGVFLGPPAYFAVYGGGAGTGVLLLTAASIVIAFLLIPLRVATQSPLAVPN